MTIDPRDLSDDELRGRLAQAHPQISALTLDALVEGRDSERCAPIIADLLAGS